MITSAIINTDKKSVAVKLLAAAAFLLTFQAYMVAPLLDDLTGELQSNRFLIGFAIPAFAIPYGLSSFFYSLLIRRYGRRNLMLSLIMLMALGIFMITFCESAGTFLIMRILLGLISGGIIPVAISMTGDLYTLGKRDQPFSWLFLGMAGGMTFGPTFGGYLYPFIGWRLEFVIVGLSCALLSYYAITHRSLFPDQHLYRKIDLKTTVTKLWHLLDKAGSRKIYGFIFFNGVFHSGLFVWISYYFSVRYHFGDQAAGIGLLLFSLPGLLMAVSIGAGTQKYGREKMVILGLLVIALTIALLVVHASFWVAVLAVTFLSVGYVMTQPLFTGIINNLRNGSVRGCALGLGTCLLFLGYGTGPILFQYLLGFGIIPGLIMLAILGIMLGLLSVGEKKLPSV